MDISTTRQRFNFSDRSKSQLATTDELIQLVLNEAINHIDFTILEGYRNEEKQNEAYENGFSKVKYPNSKHNSQPSKAVDAVPYPINWKDTERLAYFAGFIVGMSRLLLHGTGYKLISGIDWDDDNNIKEHSFLDYPHFELVKDDNS